MPFPTRRPDAACCCASVSVASVLRSLFQFSQVATLSAAVWGAPLVHAQVRAAGTIEGRVLNVSNGSYLRGARVSVEGTGRETFTDTYGQYRLTDVPVGTTKLRIFYTGLTEQNIDVSVSAGQSVTQDVNLSVGISGSDSDTIKLDPFIVASHKDTDQKSIAINEQRFAPNLKTVVAANAFGDVTEGNVGEFLKYMPGISLEYTSPDARQIIIRGVNPIYTAVGVDGMRMASAASSGSNRFFELEQVSINNVSRVETVFSPTPDLPADALGGSVNMVSKTAFEHTSLAFDYRAYLSANGDDRAINRKPGPGSEPSRKVRPGFDFSFADPISKTFGIALNASESDIYYPQHRSQPTWTPIANGLGGTPTSPFLRTYQMQDGPKNTQRESIGASIDWKFTPNDVLSIRPQWNYYNAFFGNRNINWNVQGTSNIAPTAFDGPTFVQGAPGAGNASYASSFRRKYGYTYHLGLDYIHTGSEWTFETSAAFSHASNHYHDTQDGHFENVSLTLNNLTVGFAGINQYNGVRPATITTLTAAGTPIDTFSNLGAYTISSATYNENDSSDVFKTVKQSAKYTFNVGTIESTLRMGAQVQEETRDIRKPTGSYAFVGPDGKPGTADDLAANYNLVDPSYSSVSAPYGLPQIQWPSPYTLYSLFRAHPEYFAWNQAAAIQNSVKNSQFFKETIPAAYIMGDTKLLKHRLRLVYGIRFEQTQDIGSGYLQNVNAAYQRDANGNFLLDINSKKIPLVGPNGLAITDPSNAVPFSLLTYHDRGVTAKTHYGSGFPSVNATFNVTDNLVVRAAYSRAIGRPDIVNLVPGTALPDPTGATPYTLTVNNPELKPEYANSFDVSLEYYFAKVGVLSLAAYRKDFTNFFGSNNVPATADLLNQLGIPDAAYYIANNGTVTSKFNVGKARVTGIQLDYKQSLDGLFPINGFNVFTSGYATHLTGAPNADFTNFISKAFNAGIAYDQRKFGAKLNFNYRGTQRYGLTTYTYTIPGSSPAVTASVQGYEYYKPRGQFDIDLDYRLTKNVGLFFVGRNITNVVQDDQRYTPQMPGYTHLFRREEFGVQYTVGVKGTF